LVDTEGPQEDASAVVLTIPLGSKRRVSVAFTRRAGVSAAKWHKDFLAEPPRDEEGGAGVREPSRPIRPAGTDAIALPLDEF
jgi:hypothetical protein